MSFLRGLTSEEENMNSRENLLYLSLKHNGDWQKIYEDLLAHIELDEKEVQELNKTVASKYITILDEDYPESLRRMCKPPFVLYYHGDLSLISDLNYKIAVVGSRKVSDYGKEATEYLVKDLAKDFIIVSGLAYGVDSIAHQTAIDNNGKTIAVLGCGINVCYLEQCRDLYEKIKEKHLLLSEYPNDVEPKPIYFPIRNRIIAGLCENLLVTEGKIHSGTQITALMMLAKDGNVCCVPSHIREDSVCNYLISQGAFLVESAEDIYYIAGVVSKKPVF